MTDPDIAETLRSHQEELDAFDAELYPKPWPDGESIQYVWKLHNAFYRDTGHYPRKFRMTSTMMKVVIADDMADRRFAMVTGDHPYSLFGVPCEIDESLPRYKVVPVALV